MLSPILKFLLSVSIFIASDIAGVSFFVVILRSEYLEKMDVELFSSKLF